MSQPVQRPLVVDDLVIDFAGRRLVRAGAEQALEPKAFAVLALLAGTPGRVFDRDEILDAVWGHRHVTQGVLNRIMSLLRQALGEDAQHPRLLHTVHGVGYRFDLPVATSVEVVPADARATGAAVGSSALRRRRWLVVPAAALVLMVLVVGWHYLRARHDAPPAHVDTSIGSPSLAVLPFVDLSPGQDQEYLADGLAEEILGQLARAPGLRVIGRSSSFSFKGTDADLPTIGRKLGVAYLLEGSVRRQGDRLRVSAQLVRADDGSQLWSQTYARELRDVFAVQEDIARDVARALSVTLDVAPFNRSQGGTNDVAAYERFLRWRSISMRELFDLDHDRQRLQLAREMVALDPQCVLCRDALAVSLNAMARELGGPQAEPLRTEAAQVREGIAVMAPDSWVAKRDRANALWRAGRHAEAIALMKAVVDAGPLSKERTWDYAYMIYAMGHLQDTIALVEQLRAIEPMALFLSRDLQYDYTAARRYQDAEAEYRRGQQLHGEQREPDYVAFMRQLAGRRPGDIAELRALHARLLHAGGDFDTPFFRDLAGVLDRREAMLARVRRALVDRDYAGDDGLYVAINVADALGDGALAMAVLRRHMQAQPGFEAGAMIQHAYVELWNAPYSDLRAQPDFKRLLVETGVVDYWRQTGRWGDGCGPLGPEDFQCR